MRLFFAVVCLLPAAGAIESPTFRLPDNAKPARYELEITIIPRQPAFRGVVRIDVDLLRPSNRVWLNARDLTVEQARVVANERTFTARSTTSGEFLSIEWDEPPRTGRVRVEIWYRGEMQDGRNKGLYRKRAGDHWYVYTTFTPIEARSAFPCFDEPGYKTPWRVVMQVPRGDVALSNSRMVEQRPAGPGLKRVEFAETKPLPSEVVAFAVGPFDVVADGAAGRNRVPVRVITPRGRASEAEAAKGLAAGVVAFLEDYTGIPYPWDKLDHLAVLDMPFGAVENPGLITYRAASLLARPSVSTTEHRFRLRALMAHELAHQWFGNLVTQSWWDDVWLSEGLSTWMGNKITDTELPEFQRGAGAVWERSGIMRMDATAQTRPVRMVIRSHGEIQRVYSRFVYAKAAAILRMVEDWAGVAAFQRGVREYLNRHAYGTATTADFAAALHAGSGVHIAPVLDAYLNQTGYPVIRGDCSGGTAKFTSTPDWTTPVCLRGAACFLLSGEPRVIRIDGGCSALTHLNRNGAGYFTTDVPAATVGSMLQSGAWKEMSVAERLSFVEDLRVGVTSKRLDRRTVQRILPDLIDGQDAHVSAAGYRLLVTLLASAPVEDLKGFGDTFDQILGSGRRR
jgi:cytosol alanyl aminopeptidase